jgi:cardiolipin synthase
MERLPEHSVSSTRRIKYIDIVSPAWQFYLNPPEAWEAMVRACERASTTIECEQYIFDPDGIGERFARVFIQKASEGVRVRLLLDGVGSYRLIDSPLHTQLTSAGVEVLFYNRLPLWKPYKIVSWFLRDHRKVLIVDAQTAFIGGIGISEGMQSWRDTQVSIEGELAGDIQSSFERMWRIASRQRRSFREENYTAKDSFHLLNNAPRPRRRHIYNALLKDIKESKTYVYLATAYFIPSFRLNRALIKAAQRGVDVRIMVPRFSDVHIADVAARSQVDPLLMAGAKIYQYRDGMFHAKTAVADDVWASVGSANLDNLSLLLNYETSIRSTEPRFVSEMKVGARARFLKNGKNF